MKQRPEDEIIELTAVAPDGDLACDTTIATPEARAGLSEALGAALIPPPRPIDGGIEVSFKTGGWDAVRRYVDLESHCCSFLTLSVRREADRVLLTVTGRPEAQDWIRNIFATN
jgi:hypothetical protein